MYSGHLESSAQPLVVPSQSPQSLSQAQPTQNEEGWKPVFLLIPQEVRKLGNLQHQVVIQVFDDGKQRCFAVLSFGQH